MHIRATNLIKGTLYFVRLNKCGLFNNEQNGMAAIKSVLRKQTCNDHFLTPTSSN